MLPAGRAQDALKAWQQHLDCNPSDVIGIVLDKDERRIPDFSQPDKVFHYFSSRTQP